MFARNGKSRFCFEIEMTLVKEGFHAAPHAAAMRDYMPITNARAADWIRFARKTSLLRISLRVKGNFSGFSTHTGRNCLTFSST